MGIRHRKTDLYGRLVRNALLVIPYTNISFQGLSFLFTPIYVSIHQIIIGLVLFLIKISYLKDKFQQNNYQFTVIVIFDAKRFRFLFIDSLWYRHLLFKILYTCSATLSFLQHINYGYMDSTFIR